MTTTAVKTQSRGLPWWVTLIQGIALVIIGVLLLTNPGATSVFLIQVIALYWLISGIIQLVSIFVDRTAWGWKLFAGIIGIWAGLYILQHPVGGALAFGFALIVIVGIQGIILGIVSLIQAFQGAGWGAAILGIISIILGVILLANTVIGVATLPWVLGIFAIVGGIAAIIAAFRFRSA
jgi:uncharacterized membrane protein HdeD (DUF308 family)